ncbi:hypothetical protein CaldiYA01_00650 [Caldicellulosiruptor diazotrophicus]|uniref:Uncharacterized protein n=1 Tax=Caldicellulosiruptor diazotrophicus TaxID=2806205 RepID=A0ABN6E429_9FIRM|nr:hypothetical protein CaldiYA01_00650 [Caldicellulosiruptor diazotrophicus]
MVKIAPQELNGAALALRLKTINAFALAHILVLLLSQVGCSIHTRMPTCGIIQVSIEILSSFINFTNPELLSSKLFLI